MRNMSPACDVCGQPAAHSLGGRHLCGTHAGQARGPKYKYSGSGEAPEEPKEDPGFVFKGIRLTDVFGKKLEGLQELARGDGRYACTKQAKKDLRLAKEVLTELYWVARRLNLDVEEMFRPPKERKNAIPQGPQGSRS